MFFRVCQPIDREMADDKKVENDLTLNAQHKKGAIPCTVTNKLVQK